MLQISHDVVLCKASVALVEVMAFPVRETVAKVAAATRSQLIDSPALTLCSC